METRTCKNQVTQFIKRSKLPLKTRAEKKRFHDAMRNACMVGACEERRRCSKILRQYSLTEPVKDICNVSVLRILGFEKGGK